MVYANDFEDNKFIVSKNMVRLRRRFPLSADYVVRLRRYY